MTGNTSQTRENCITDIRCYPFGLVDEAGYDNTYTFLSDAYIYRSLPQPQLRVSLMTSFSSPTLRQLRRLDGSSSDFTDKLYDILCGPGYVECETNFAQDDAVWLADYLDNVRYRVAVPCSSLRQLQALGYIDPSSPASRKCLSALRKVCGTREILPTSYTLPSQHLGVDSASSTFERSRDVCEGTLGGSRVRIKRVRVSTEDVRKPAAKVHLTPSFCLSSLTQRADVL